MNWLIIFTILIAFCCVQCQNVPDFDLKDLKNVNFLTLESPFKMRKTNLLWDKARKRLSQGKLELLFSELKLHDKDEWNLKRLKAEEGDKDGMREAEVRKKYLGIMNKYSLANFMPEEPTPPKWEKQER